MFILDHISTKPFFFCTLESGWGKCCQILPIQQKISILNDGCSTQKYTIIDRKHVPPPATTWTSVRCGCLPKFGITQVIG